MTSANGILSLVQSLGPELTSVEIGVRGEAIKKLTHVVEESVQSLSEAEVGILLEFYLARVGDTDALTVADYVFKGLHALCVTSVNLPLLAEIQVTSLMLQEQSVQSWPQTTRLHVFQILDKFLTTRVKNLIPLGDQFMVNFCRSIEGERDPRCLLLVFRLFVLVCQNFNIGAFVSDLFEIVACYFPIDFNPPDNDAYKITSEQLSQGLSQCLICHSSFGAPCYELIVEKLEENDANNTATVNAAVKLLLQACDVFPVDVTRNYSETIWETTRKQALLGKFAQGEDLAIEAIGKLVKICVGIKNDKNELVAVILRDCEPFMVNLEMQLVNDASKILQRVACVSRECCVQITEKVIPMLMERCQYDPQNGEDRDHEYEKTFAPLLAKWMQIVIKMQASQSIVSLLDGLCTLALNLTSADDVILCVAGVKIASQLLKLKLEQISLDKISKIFDLALSKCDNQDICVACSELTYSCAENHWNWFKENYAKLEKDAMANAELLKILVWSSCDFETMKCVQKTVLSSLTNEKVIASLPNITDNWVKSCERKSLMQFKLWNDVIERIREIAQGNVENTLILAKVLKRITLAFDEESEKSFVDFCMTKCDLSNSNLIDLICPSLWSLNPKSAEYLWEELSPKLKKLSNSLQDNMNLHHLLCSLVNKCTMSTFDDVIIELYHQNMNPTELDVIRLSNVTRACILKPIRVANKTCVNLGITPESTLNETDIGPGLLREMLHLLSQGKCDGNMMCKVLNLDVNCECSIENTRYCTSFLYRQRILLTIIPLFINAFNKAPLDSRGQFFPVFVSILHLAKDHADFVSPEMSHLLPVLVLSLGENCGDRVAIVEALKQVLSTADSAKAIHSHMNTVTKHIVNMLNNDNPMNVKLGVLDVMSCMARPGIFPTHLRTQLRPLVCRGLKGALADRKRLVRMKAGQVNNMWELNSAA